MRGLFVTFEGMEGSGKSTQIRLLREKCESIGVPVLFSKEPGGTALGSELRTLLLKPHGSGEKWCAMSELLLFYADRAQHLEKMIHPALAMGKVVLVDRFEDSSWAYQSACGVSQEALGALRRLVLGDFAPDLTFVLDLEPEKALARVKARNGQDFVETRFDEESLAFHTRVREGFRAIAEREPGRVKLIAADGPPEAIFITLWETMGPYLRQWGYHV